jgi:hypothetical protein
MNASKPASIDYTIDILFLFTADFWVCDIGTFGRLFGKFLADFLGTIFLWEHEKTTILSYQSFLIRGNITCRMMTTVIRMVVLGKQCSRRYFRFLFISHRTVDVGTIYFQVPILFLYFSNLANYSCVFLLLKRFTK